MTSKIPSHFPRRALLGLTGGALAVSGLLVGLPTPAAQACGCFAPPDPSVPIVQAGERILFSQANGEVVAHIQIQYSGKPGDFGWLLPLPAVPKDRTGKDGIELGVDELFSQLTSTTQPKYRLRRIFPDCGGGLSRSGGNAGVFASAEDSGQSPSAPPAPSPLVLKDSIGPYDYAILKADSQADMFKWLSDNRYFVPAGTEKAVGPYIHPGGFFLALKLRAGLDAGDLQPVVLRYKSDLPMIPIILTSVAATPNMGVQVWMLGAGRAIPRNYYHTVVNDAQVNWLTSGANYNDVIIKAVGEATGKHAFVTEYAGSSDRMRNVLDRPGRYNDLPALGTVTDPIQFVQRALGMFSVNSQLTTLLSRYIPLPAALAAEKVSLASYYQQISSYLGQDRTRNPAKYADIAAALAAFPANAPLLAADLKTKIAEPTLDAGSLFTAHPYLTRLYTTLSPEDMTSDPVFSYNPSLPGYDNVHEATLTYHCAGFFSKERYSDALLETPSGFSRQFSNEELNNNEYTPLAAPFSQQIQVLRETGAPEVLVDNTDTIKSALRTDGCTLVSLTRSQGAASYSLSALLGLSSLALLLRRRRTQRSAS